MSRLAKKPIEMPEGTEVTFKNDLVTVKGKKGQLEQKVLNGIDVKVENSEMWVSLKEKTNLKKPFFRTFQIAHWQHGHWSEPGV